MKQILIPVFFAFYLILMFIDALLMWDVFQYVLPTLPTQVAVTVIFILAINVLPVLGAARRLKKQIDDAKFRKLLSLPPDNSDTSFIEAGFLAFLAFSLIFCLLSVRNAGRFGFGQDAAMSALFGEDAITTVDEGRQRVAAWFAGVLPFLTTIIAFLVQILIGAEDKEERLRKEIAACEARKAQLEAKHDQIEKKKRQLALLEDCIASVEQRINEYIDTRKAAFLERDWIEQWSIKKDALNKIAAQCRIYLAQLRKRGNERFEFHNEKNPTRSLERYRRWILLLNDIEHRTEILLAGAEVDAPTMPPPSRSRKRRRSPLEFIRHWRVR